MTARAQRPLDGIAYSFLALLVVLLHPSAGRDQLGRLSMVIMIPVIIAVVSGIRLGSALVGLPTGEQCRRSLILTGLAFAGLMPFVPWWCIATTDRYLFVCAILAVYAGVMFLYHVNLAVYLLAAHHELPGLFGATGMLRYIILYLNFCGYSAIAVIILVQVFAVDFPPDIAIISLFFHSVIRPIVYAALGIWLTVVAVAGVVFPLRLSYLIAHRHPTSSPPTPPCPIPPAV